MAIKKGNKFANSIVGTGGPDTIYGFEGNDTLRGQGGNDKLLGGTGNDKLYGGSGNDVINGDLGNDTMWGGFGADRFQFASGSGVDVIGDFDVEGGDTIRLPMNVNGSPITNFATLVAATVDQNGDAVIDLGGGNRLILDGVSKQMLQPNDFIFG